jgi:hypothetical protein
MLPPARSQPLELLIRPIETEDHRQIEKGQKILGCDDPLLGASRQNGCYMLIQGFFVESLTSGRMISARVKEKNPALRKCGLQVENGELVVANR